MVACALCTVISVTVSVTAVATIIITVSSVGLIIANTVSNPLWMRATWKQLSIIGQFAIMEIFFLTSVDHHIEFQLTSAILEFHQRIITITNI
jgi:hypothetical protein